MSGAPRRPPARLQVLGRAGCHLCQDMLLALERWPDPLPGVEFVDIDRDPELLRRWGDKIPVLMADGHYVCHYFLDTKALKTLFREPL